MIALENVRLFTELEARNRELTEALEQQTATSEVLKAISRSAFDLQPVLQTLAENAIRLCAADRVFIFRFDGELLRAAASYNASAELRERVERTPVAPGRHSVSARAALERRTVQVVDAQADPEYSYFRYDVDPIRTILAVPMLKADELVGTITIWRTEVKPFTEAQIALLETFADQAVIAIENVRLFQELQARNRELSDALEQQTATSEILRAISSSPTDVQPVFEAIAQSAVQLCEAVNGSVFRFDGSLIHPVALYGMTPQALAAHQRVFPLPPGRGTATGRAILTHDVVHVNITQDPEYAYEDFVQAGFRTVLSVPMLRDGDPIGAITVTREEGRLFSETQIALLQTFADQAVIAIENVRLFTELEARNRELTESLEQQTATAEILRVISSSPTDLQPVMDTVAESAARVCGAIDSSIFRLDGNALRLVALHGALPSPLGVGETIPVTRDTVTGRAVSERRTIHVEDILALPETEFQGRARWRHSPNAVRTFLSAPLLREGVPLGAILIRRREARPFSAKQIELLETFARRERAAFRAEAEPRPRRRREILRVSQLATNVSRS